MSSISESSFQDFGQPISAGMVSTEGEKLLNALRKIQFKLKDKHQRHEKSGEKALNYDQEVNKTKDEERDNYSMRGSGDHHFRPDLKSGHRCHEPVMCIHKTSEDIINSQLIETRLKLIETQLQNISMQLMANNCVKNETTVQKDTKKVSVTNGRHKESPKKTRISSIDDHIISDDKYESSINAIKQMVRSSGDRINQRISKSVSMDGINSRNNGSKHFHLQMNLQNIPFILGTNSSKSHSVIANRQIEFSRLKQHNSLCNDRTHNRKLFDQTLKTKVLDNEIKELLYDLQEEHNYICEEIHYLSKQLEKIRDPNKRADFNRELYFLSRRILAKKRQINELQELHEIVRKNSLRERSDQSLDTKPSKVKRLCQMNQML